MTLVLRLPTPSEETEVLRAHRATTPDFPNFLHYYEEGMPFGRYLDVLAEQARGEHLPLHHVPATFLFAFVGPSIVGRASIRHTLTPVLARIGGHIGYAVVPEYRRQGHATEILRQSILIARQTLGLTRVLVTCDDDNIGSIRVIEKNGGVLEDVVPGWANAQPKRRYWIATTDGSAQRLSLPRSPIPPLPQPEIAMTDTTDVLHATNLGCSITCKDLEVSIRWYRDVIGFAVEQTFESDGKVAAAVIAAGDIRIVLNQDDGQLGWDRIKGQGCYLQIGVASAADVDAAAARLRDAGWALLNEPADRPWGARMFQFKDPDGFKLGVSTPLAG